MNRVSFSLLIFSFLWKYFVSALHFDYKAGGLDWIYLVNTTCAGLSQSPINLDTITEPTPGSFNINIELVNEF